MPHLQSCAARAVGGIVFSAPPSWWTGDSIKAKEQFSRGLGSRSLSCLSTWMYLGRLLHASLQPAACLRPETIFIFLSVLSPTDADGWVMAPRRRRQSAGRAPPCPHSLPPSRRDGPLDRAAAPLKNGALASLSVRRLRTAKGERWPIRGTVRGASSASVAER